MSFIIAGLPPEEFQDLYDLPEAALAARGVVRQVADRRPGFPCRITLEDAAPGERVLLLHYESHKASTPYRSAYAVYVREGARESRTFIDEIAPVLRGRPLALRHFDREGMLVGASLVMDGGVREAIVSGFDNPATVYIDAHNAAHGCFAARIRRH